jgi:hypothetical protein
MTRKWVSDKFEAIKNKEKIGWHSKEYISYGIRYMEKCRRFIQKVNANRISYIMDDNKQK